MGNNIIFDIKTCQNCGSKEILRYKMHPPVRACNNCKKHYHEIETCIFNYFTMWKNDNCKIDKNKNKQIASYTGGIPYSEFV